MIRRTREAENMRISRVFEMAGTPESVGRA
jgi:hypothetical protein